MKSLLLLLTFLLTLANVALASETYFVKTFDWVDTSGAPIDGKPVKIDRDGIVTFNEGSTRNHIEIGGEGGRELARAVAAIGDRDQWFICGPARYVVKRVEPVHVSLEEQDRRIAKHHRIEAATNASRARAYANYQASHAEPLAIHFAFTNNIINQYAAQTRQYGNSNGRTHYVRGYVNSHGTWTNGYYRR